jgi:hypothetical protein
MLTVKTSYIKRNYPTMVAKQDVQRGEFELYATKEQRHAATEAIKIRLARPSTDPLSTTPKDLRQELQLAQKAARAALDATITLADATASRTELIQTIMMSIALDQSTKFKDGVRPPQTSATSKVRFPLPTYVSGRGLVLTA